MKITKTYGIIAFGLTTLFVGVTSLSVRSRMRDKKAATLLELIQSKTSDGNTQLNAEKAFDVNYLNEVLSQAKNQVLVIQKKVAMDYAKSIEKAWGSWYEGGDNEMKVYSVFRQLKDKVQVSQIAQAYQELFKENLIDVIRERFSTNEINELLKIVNS